MTVQFLHPKVGTKVRVTTRFPDTYFRAESPWKDEWLEGVVLPNHKLTNPNSFVLRVKCGMVPIREINLKNVTDLVNLDGSVAEKSVVDNEIKTLQVKGSKGDEYLVTKEGNKTTCTCVGFQYRKACKHLEMIK